MVTRANTWQNAYATGTAKLDLGDGIVIPLPIDGTFPGEPGPPGAGVPEGGAALQVVRKNAAGTTTEWVSPSKSMVGLGNTDNTADADKPISTPTQAAFDAKADAEELVKKVAKGDFFINVRDAPYNAGQGADDDSAAINQAAADALTKKRALFLAGDFNIRDTVIVKCDVYSAAAKLNYTGVGRALQVGTDGSGVYVTDKWVGLPLVVNVSAPAGTWDGTSEGVVIFNTNQCRIDVPRVELFEKGLVFMGNGGGTAYTEVTLGSLWVNHENIVFDQGPAATAWTNQINLHGGRITHSLSRGSSDDPVACHVRLGNNAGGSLNPPDGITFFGTSFEGVNSGVGGWARNRVINYGRYNQFFNCRWETSAGIPVIDSREFASNTIIWGGYHADKLKLTGVGGAVTVKDGVEGLVEANDTTSPVLATGADTTLKTWVTPTLAKCTYDSATGMFTPAAGRWRITATVTFPANGTGTRTVKLYVENTVKAQKIAPASSLGAVSVEVERSHKFNGTQAFRIVASQASGADMALVGTAPYVTVQAVLQG